MPSFSNAFSNAFDVVANELIISHKFAEREVLVGGSLDFIILIGLKGTRVNQRSLLPDLPVIEPIIELSGTVVRELQGVNDGSFSFVTPLEIQGDTIDERVTLLNSVVTGAEIALKGTLLIEQEHVDMGYLSTTELIRDFTVKFREYNVTIKARR